MSSDKPLRRLPLRQLLANTDKCARDLVEQVHTNLQQRLAECRDLTRPTRRKSNFPTVMAFQNGMRHLDEAHAQIVTIADLLLDHLEAVREHAQKEKLSRR